MNTSSLPRAGGGEGSSGTVSTGCSPRDVIVPRRVLCIDMERVASNVGTRFACPAPRVGAMHWPHAKRGACAHRWLARRNSGTLRGHDTGAARGRPSDARRPHRGSNGGLNLSLGSRRGVRRSGLLALIEAEPLSASIAISRRRKPGDGGRVRRSRGDAPPARHEGGGSAVHRARRFGRRLGRRQVIERQTALADAAVGAAVDYLLADARRRGKILAHRPGRGAARAMSSSPWARWARASSTIRAISTSSCSTTRRPRSRNGAGVVLCPAHARLVKLLQERTADGYVFRTDLRLRPDPGVDPDRDLDRRRARLLREPSARTGSARR